MYEQEDIVEIRICSWMSNQPFCTHVLFKDGNEWCSHSSWKLGNDPI